MIKLQAYGIMDDLNWIKHFLCDRHQCMHESGNIAEYLLRLLVASLSLATSPLAIQFPGKCIPVSSRPGTLRQLTHLTS